MGSEQGKRKRKAFRRIEQEPSHFFKTEIRLQFRKSTRVRITGHAEPTGRGPPVQLKMHSFDASIDVFQDFAHFSKFE